jgi:Asp-tRNA(Asn)/Glu-tRNA(Gln) amidotransferase A subunit family amidase
MGRAPGSAYFPAQSLGLSTVPGGSSRLLRGGRVLRGSKRARSDTGGRFVSPPHSGSRWTEATYGRVSRRTSRPLRRWTRSAIADRPRGCGSYPAVIATMTATIRAQLRVRGHHLSEIGKRRRGLRVAVPKEWFGSGLDRAVDARIKDALRREALGGSIIEVSCLTANTRSGYTTSLLRRRPAPAWPARCSEVRLSRPQPERLEDMYTSSRPGRRRGQTPYHDRLMCSAPVTTTHIT